MLDEPSLGLAPILVEAVFATVEKIIAHGLSILLVEQNIFYAIDLASRCYLLENGTITLEGLRVEFTDNPQDQGGLPRDVTPVSLLRRRVGAGLKPEFT